MKTAAAKAAKRLKKELKNEFPDTKFSVTSENYSGGSSVNVKYTDGPRKEEVKKIANKYQYGHFDGMEDLYRYSNSRDDIPQARHVFVNRDMSEEVIGELEPEVREKFNVEDKGLHDDFTLPNGRFSTVYGEMYEVFAKRSF